MIRKQDISTNRLKPGFVDRRKKNGKTQEKIGSKQSYHNDCCDYFIPDLTFTFNRIAYNAKADCKLQSEKIASHSQQSRLH